MNFTFRHMAVLLILFYLSLPVAGYAHTGIATGAVPGVLTGDGFSADAPCDQCPCNDEHGTDCCDTASCSCTFHFPPEQNVRIRYAPDVILVRQTESFRALPQVYLPIFVPPQNLSEDSSHVCNLFIPAV